MQLGGLCRGLTIESRGMMLDCLAGEQFHGIASLAARFRRPGHYHWVIIIK